MSYRCLMLDVRCKKLDVRSKKEEGRCKMDQETKWQIRYDEVVEFIETNKRNPSKYVDEERNMVNYLKHTRKQLNQGVLKDERIEEFRKLQELMERYRRKNQYE